MPTQNSASSVPRSTWFAFGAISILLLVAYAPAVRSLIYDWINDENVGHGFFVPLVAAYVVWQKRDRLLETSWRTNWFGLVIVIGAALQFYVATLGVELFLQRTALVFAIIGSVLLVGGTQILRLLAFPLFLLFFMIPIPAIIYNQITLPLQFFASEVAEKWLMVFGIPVLREGNILELPSQRLSVVEACSGIRSLLSLSFLSLVYGYFLEEKRIWIRVALFFATIPIAILSNAGRVTVTGVVSEIDVNLATGLFHSMEGWVIFLVAVCLLVLTHKLITVATAFAAQRRGGSPQ